MDKKKWIRHLPLYILELVVLLAAIGALYFYYTCNEGPEAADQRRRYCCG